MEFAHRLIRFARKSARGKMLLLQPAHRAILGRLEDWGREVPHTGSDRTAYIVGLFGSGRWYVNELLLHNIGRRAKYLRDALRVHPNATSMIYTGHATLKYPCCWQSLPEETRRILECVKSGLADLIFVYRHPLDSLLTNWVCWRTWLHHKRWVAGIHSAYKAREQFCADLDGNFREFLAFAEGVSEFFSGMPYSFLSLAQYVEETELHLSSATLALSLEAFAIDAHKEFSKLAEVMSAQPDLLPVRLMPPRSKPFGYRLVRESVPRFRAFIESIDAATRARIERIGYTID